MNYIAIWRVDIRNGYRCLQMEQRTHTEMQEELQLQYQVFNLDAVFIVICSDPASALTSIKTGEVKSHQDLLLEI